MKGLSQPLFPASLITTSSAVHWVTGGVPLTRTPLTRSQSSFKDTEVAIQGHMKRYLELWADRENWKHSHCMAR